MTDQEFLNWIADRLVLVYGDNPNVDYIHKLRAIARASGDRITPNVGSPSPAPAAVRAANKRLEDMSIEELMMIDHACSVCIGLSPSGDGHDKNPPCVGAARDEILLRAKRAEGISS